MQQPVEQWQRRHILLWLCVMALVCWWRGPAFRRAFEPDLFPPGYRLFLPDFFQEWASARNRLEGLPIYTPQEVTLQRYLGVQRPAGDPSFQELNAHPPTSVLLGLPFAMLDFSDAFLLWNILSLAGLVLSLGWIVQQLRLAVTVWHLLPTVSLLLLCHPFWHNMVHGQINLLLLPLLTGIWVADRCHRPGWAGLLLGVATTIKLFPGFLLVYFICRRQWRIVAATVATVMGLSVATALILGADVYRSYFVEVLPYTSLYCTDWHNLSLSGIGCKLFDARKPMPEVKLQPLLQSPRLALLSMGACVAVMAAVVAGLTPRLCQQGDSDRAFAVSLIAMLLASPITWDVSLLLLAMPLALLWLRIEQGSWTWEALLVLLAIFWLEPALVMEHGLILLEAAHQPGTGDWLATPVDIVTALSVPCYALVGLLVLTAQAAPASAGFHTPPR